MAVVDGDGRERSCGRRAVGRRNWRIKKGVISNEACLVPLLNQEQRQRRKLVN